MIGCSWISVVTGIQGVGAHQKEHNVMYTLIIGTTLLALVPFSFLFTVGMKVLRPGTRMTNISLTAL